MTQWPALESHKSTFTWEAWRFTEELLEANPTTVASRIKRFNLSKRVE